MELVKVYDFETEQLSVIPQAELAPGMAQANVTGVGRVWIDPRQIKNGDLVHPPFDTDLRKMIGDRIMRRLAEVEPKSLEEWEDGFHRDLHAEQEMAIWIVLAERFQDFLREQARPLNKAQRQEVYRLMVNATCLHEKYHTVAK